MRNGFVLGLKNYLCTINYFKDCTWPLSHSCVDWSRILLKTPVLIPEQGSVQSSHYGLQYMFSYTFMLFKPLLTKMLGSARITQSSPNHHWGRGMASLNFWNYFKGIQKLEAYSLSFWRLKLSSVEKIFSSVKRIFRCPLLAYRCSRHLHFSSLCFFNRGVRKCLVLIR